jgi:hypothetical protein
MSFVELVKTFWVWWVTEGGLMPYNEEIVETRGVQLVMVIGVIVFLIAIIVNKNLRKKFW